MPLITHVLFCNIYQHYKAGVKRIKNIHFSEFCSFPNPQKIPKYIKIRKDTPAKEGTAIGADEGGIFSFIDI